MFKLLIDTCVWLDLSKDSRQQAILAALEELCASGEVGLIVPRIVIDEFDRNKQRVAEESGKSLSGVIKRVKDAVNQFGDDADKTAVLRHLTDVDHKIPFMGEAAFSSIARVEKLLAGGHIVETSEAVLIRAAKRAIELKAPFHRPRNGMADAIIIEIYRDAMVERGRGLRFAFVSHNVKDFSHPRGSDLLPHPDLEGLFSRLRSLYFISLAAALQRVNPEAVSESMFYAEMHDDPRGLSEILEEENRLRDWIWYNRHWNWIAEIQAGRHSIVPDKDWHIGIHAKATRKSIFEGAARARRAMEKKYGKKNLGPWTDFEWGMLNGKLSALRWVTGEEWDFLDT